MSQYPKLPMSKLPKSHNQTSKITQPHMNQIESTETQATSATGEGWAEVALPLNWNGGGRRVRGICVDGVLPPDELVNPPLGGGPWTAEMLGKLQHRDQVERNARNFGHFESYDAIPKVDKNKRGVLRWKRPSHLKQASAASPSYPSYGATPSASSTSVDGVWESVLFVLNASRSTLACRSATHRRPVGLAPLLVGSLACVFVCLFVSRLYFSCTSSPLSWVQSNYMWRTRRGA
jgi:hypothetical protein